MRTVIEFYDVPVYRVSPKKYEKDITDFVQSYVDAQGERVRSMWWESYGGAWLYNEIIGCLRLHFFGSQIRAEYFAVKAKRIVKTRKKQFEYRTHKLAPETVIPADADNNEIWSAILEHLEDCRRQLKGRYVDSSLLEVIGPHVDWQTIRKDA